MAFESRLTHPALRTRTPRPHHAQADKAQQPCYTEATDRANLPALLALGFSVVETTTLFGEELFLLSRAPVSSPV